MDALPNEQITTYTNRPDSVAEYLSKLYRYRSLIWVFAMRDLRVKYSQTFIGIGWSLLQPLTALVIFTYLFGHVLNWTAGELPYSLYVLSGLLGWNFFSYIVSAGSGSVQESSGLIRKIYFPKSILPLSKALVALVELGLSLLLLIPLMVYFGHGLSWRILALPLVILFNGLCGLTLVFWVAAFAYRKRDLFHLLPFVVYFGIWMTPVFFVAHMLPAKVSALLNLNPMASVVNLWRWMLFGGSFSMIWTVSFATMLFVCLSGMFYFHRREGEFSDYA
jgi:lipopolysaccharide transport system permease protein